MGIAKIGSLDLFLQCMTNMDSIDADILRALSRNGRMPNTELADRVGLSPSACLRRVQELERSGAIKGYRAVIDPSARGGGFLSYITVGLSEHTKAAQEGFERAMTTFPEVRECHNVTGTIEYLLRVECASLEAYKEFHTNRLGALPHVRQITSHIVMGSPKDERA